MWCGHNPPHPDCRKCYLAQTSEKYQKFWNLSKFVEPSFFKKGWTFLGAIVKHAWSGFENVSDEEFKKRINICGDCPEKSGDTCKLCGCNLKLKQSWVSSHCPINKW